MLPLVCVCMCVCGRGGGLCNERGKRIQGERESQTTLSAVVPHESQSQRWILLSSLHHHARKMCGLFVCTREDWHSVCRKRCLHEREDAVPLCVCVCVYVLERWMLVCVCMGKGGRCVCERGRMVYICVIRRWQ